MAPRVAPYRLIGGALRADVGARGDAEQFAALLELCAADGTGDAESIAARAQSWRLPVLPFRRRRPGDLRDAPRVPVPNRAVHDAFPRERLAALRVLDLSTMWAGPLATWLLADLGAKVTRVTFPGRPDGLFQGPAARLFATLAVDKEEVALDLRNPVDRGRFEALVLDADILVESYSRRVMPNLGYDPAALRALNPGLLIGSVRAFPAWRPERDWLGYGPASMRHSVSESSPTAASPAPSSPTPTRSPGSTSVAAAARAGPSPPTGHGPLGRVFALRGGRAAPRLRSRAGARRSSGGRGRGGAGRPYPF